MSIALPITATNGLTATMITTAAIEASAGLSPDDPIVLEPVTPTVEIAAGTELSTTAEGDNTSQTTLQNVAAIVPDIEINLYTEASEKSSVLRTLRAPEVLTILQADAYWVQGETTDGIVGWVEAYWLTYSGDISQLPRELHYRTVIEDKADLPEQTGSKLPFTYGTIISVEGAESYPLLDNPKNPDSQLTEAPVGADVTLLFSAEGTTTYGSSLWYYVEMSDPAGKNVLWQGYLPAAVVVER